MHTPAEAGSPAWRSATLSAMSRPIGPRLYRYGLFAFLLAVLGAFLIWPILLTVVYGFQRPDGAFTAEYLLSVFQDRVWMQGLGNSLRIAVCTTILTLCIAMPLALLSARYNFRGKGVVTSILLVPLILPPFVGAIGARAIFGRAGALNALLTNLGVLGEGDLGIDFLGGDSRFWGVIVMESLHLYPILYLNLAAALANLDPAMDEAALGLGASPWQRFWKITLPLVMPGLFAGGTIVFIWSFTELGTPLMFDYYKVTPVQIFWGVQEVAANPRPYALVVVMLVVSVALYAVGKLAFGGRAYAMQSKASIASVLPTLRGWRGAAAAGAFLLVTFLAVLPHIGVILSSFSSDGAWYQTVLPSDWTGEHYANALSHPLAMGSIINSLKYALAAMIICVAIGLAIAYLNVRVKIPGGWLLDSLAMLPLAVPGLVMAFGYVAMTFKWPFNTPLLKPWFDIVGREPYPVIMLIIAYAIRRLPYVVRSASAGLEQTSGQLEEAALNLGASTGTAIRRIVVPLIMANLIAGGILAFSFAMLEVSDSLILAQTDKHFPITKAIFEFFNRLGDGPYIASAMGVWAMALLTVTLVGAAVMLGKRMGAIFRV